jgi:hypothetical protein
LRPPSDKDIAEDSTRQWSQQSKIILETFPTPHYVKPVKPVLSSSTSCFSLKEFRISSSTGKAWDREVCEIRRRGKRKLKKEIKEKKIRDARERECPAHDAGVRNGQ